MTKIHWESTFDEYAFQRQLNFRSQQVSFKHREPLQGSQGCLSIRYQVWGKKKKTGFLAKYCALFSYKIQFKKHLVLSTKNELKKKKNQLPTQPLDHNQSSRQQFRDSKGERVQDWLQVICQRMGRWQKQEAFIGNVTWPWVKSWESFTIFIIINRSREKNSGKQTKTLYTFPVIFTGLINLWPKETSSAFLWLPLLTFVPEAQMTGREWQIWFLKMKMPTDLKQMNTSSCLSTKNIAPFTEHSWIPGAPRE